MIKYASCVYTGTVVHKRLTPRQHAFSYRVFSLCLDVDEIDRLDSDLRFFSRNRWNLIGFNDDDMGAGGGHRVGDHARKILRDAGLEMFANRIVLLCYPRLLGYVFNPLSVYYCHDANGRLGVLIYEVSNTFRERRSYMITVTPGGVSGGIIWQACDKELYVSPFTQANGRYGFHVTPPGDRIVVGVDFRATGNSKGGHADRGQAVLKTHFRGERRELSDRTIVGLMLDYPLLTLKVVAAIHLEAANLWRKGVPLVQRHASPRYSCTIVKPSPQDLSHV